MKWIKKGHIFKPDGRYEWSNSYAQIPRPLILKDRVRIFYATRSYDYKNIPLSQSSFIDVDINDLSKIMYVHHKPSLSLGPVNSFSHFGIHPTMLLKYKDETWFFYQGWNRCVEVPYETTVGVAISIDDGLNFTKTSEFPIFGKSKEDPNYVNGVFIFETDSQYVMYYSSGSKWIEEDGKKESVYKIKIATSNDLLTWKRTEEGCIESNLNYECQNSATVIKINDKYHMWFCYRPALDFRNSERGYRIGYATSTNLFIWHREDSLAGIDISQDDSWDSQMICYPYVFKINEKIVMLYCGNYFGREGFGYAELELDK